MSYWVIKLDVTRRRGDPPDVPCFRGCDADAWDIEPDGRLHFVACRRGEPVAGARPWMGALYGVGRWLRSLLTKGPAK